ncbi:MAG: FAD-binding oxidoreductase [Chloroflexi bacterium]|nr:FAD-binding oxidoreductase [Chloroflexota bacterium]MCY3939118.1 FAD-binding oxidoreductase [Chloroflexota bacterium]
MSKSIEDLAASITDAVAGREVTSGPALDEWSVDGLSPQVCVEPHSAEEMAAVLKAADDARAAVVPRGSGTKLALGNVPSDYRISVSTARLDKVLEYTPADMTVSVQAGITLAELQKILAQENQFLPLDPPYGETATIGGVLAANSSGPLRAAYGTARDLLIGIRVAHPDGLVTKAGGKVVKNVTGYDLNKLYTGSLGTLGVIVEANFKLQPFPAVQRSVLAVMQPDAASNAVDALVDSVLMPSAVDLFDSRALSRLSPNANGGRGLLVKFGGNAKAVDRQIRDIRSICSEATHIDVLSGEEQELVWNNARELQVAAAAAGAAVCKISVLSSEVPQVFDEVRPAADSAGLEAMVWGRAVNGICHAAIYGADSDPAAVRSAIELLRSRLGGGSRSVVVESCPPAVKDGLDVWGDTVDPVALRIMKSIKQKFDPNYTLNPGRFVGGI